MSEGEKLKQALLKARLLPSDFARNAGCSSTSVTRYLRMDHFEPKPWSIVVRGLRRSGINPSVVREEEYHYSDESNGTDHVTNLIHLVEEMNADVLRKIETILESDRTSQVTVLSWIKGFLRGKSQ